MRRYAIYYAPRWGEPLAKFARSWLGRDAERDRACSSLTLDAISAERIGAITAEPRIYGFHGTLKAPFTLAKGKRESDFLEQVERFAADRKTVPVGRVTVKRLGSFVAMVPETSCPALDALAADCVRSFERFRRPLSGHDLTRRRAAGLTARQDELLRQWGYPYVLDEFRFHLTLTGPLAKPERGHVRRLLASLTKDIRSKPLVVRDLVVFVQPSRGSPFRVLARYPLSGTW